MGFRNLTERRYDIANTVAGMAADMEVHMVAIMEVDMVANKVAEMEVDEVVNIFADIVAKKDTQFDERGMQKRRRCTQFDERVGHGGWLIGPKLFRP